MCHLMHRHTRFGVVPRLRTARRGTGAGDRIRAHYVCSPRQMARAADVVGSWAYGELLREAEHAPAARRDARLHANV